MKKLEIIIKPEKLERVKKILDENGATGAMISNIMGYGNQKGYQTTYRGSQMMINLLPKIKIETVMTDQTAENLISALEEYLSSDKVGAGKIFLYDVADAVRLRTGERGEQALQRAGLVKSGFQSEQALKQLSGMASYLEGDTMKHRIQEYLKYIDGILQEDKNDQEKDAGYWDQEIVKHLEQIRFFQHERLVHLIVFSLVAVCTVMSILFYVAYEKIILLPLILMLFVLLVPYCMHYYLLENSVQKMYDQYDQMQAKKKEYFQVKK